MLYKESICANKRVLEGLAHNINSEAFFNFQKFLKICGKGFLDLDLTHDGIKCEHHLLTVVPFLHYDDHDIDVVPKLI